MDTAELDIAIHELENRVERLRALYEQYFLGIEKIEPAVARKDVDRRVWTLRREKIRNTARRFKLQTIIQRYNTFQQYWQRICREIENGTYRRHVLRAERATSTVSDLVAKQAKQKAEAEQKKAAAVATSAAEQDLADMLARDIDAEKEFARAVQDATRVEPRAPKQRHRLDTLDLELEGLEPSEPTAGALSGVATPGARPETPSQARSGNLLAALGPRSTEGASGSKAIAGPTPRRTRRTRGARPALKPSLPRAGDAPAPSPSEPRSTAASREQSSSAAEPRPAAARPARPAASTSARAPAAPANRPTNAKAGLTDQRIAELHRQLVATKQRTKETGQVSVAGLAKSLRAAESKLKQQHKNRRIDFDVVVKNGKAVVKPIVR